MWRDTVDPNKFQTVDQQWSGYLTDNQNFIVWRDDGWKLLYHDHRLTSLVTDNNHTFTWDYDQSGMPASVSEDGQALVAVESNSAGQVAALVINGKRYEVQYAERPITQILMGQPAIKELDQALSSLKYPDGRSETFKFTLTSNLVPTLTFTNPDKQQTVYSWDDATNYILTENGQKGDWTYKIGEINDPFSFPAISRTNSQGASEGVSVDSKSGIYTARNKDGTSVVTDVFETRGPLYHKVKSVNRVSPNGKTTLIYKLSYDEAGKIIRKVDQDGFITNYAYDKDGKFLNLVVQPPSDPVVLAALKARETQLLKQISSAPSPEQRGDLLEELAFFYIHQYGLPDKALALLPEVTNRKQAFNIQMHAIDGNLNLTGQQKAEQFKKLLQQYPEEEHLLNILIVARPRDDLMNAQALNKQ